MNESEQELRRSRGELHSAADARFASFMQHLPGAAWIKDAEGCYVYANEYAQRIFRTPMGELLGRTDEQLFPPETARQFRENDLRVLELRRGIQTVEQLQHEDGVHTSVVSKFPIFDADGRVLYVGGIAIDITEQRRAEDALRSSEERLRLALEAGRMGAWEWNILTGELRWSENLLGLHGVTAETFEGTLEAFQRLVHPDDRDLLQTAISRAIEQHSPYEAEFRIVWPDGSVRWMSGSGKAFYDERGTPTHMIGIGADITERRESAERLRDSEERFRGLMEQAPFSVQVFTPDGRTTRVNRAWEELWGVSLEQIGDYNILEDRQLEARGVLSYIKRAFAGEPVRIPAIEYDPNETIPDVSQHSEPRWTSAVAYPLKDSSGLVRQVVLMHQDITAERRAEEALRESEQRFRQLADAMSQIVWTAGPDGNIDYLNRRWTEFTGLSQTSGNDAWDQLMHPDDAPAAYERWAASLRTGEPFDMQIRLFDRREQAYRWHLIRTAAVKNEAGKVTRWFGTSTDIHEQKQAEESSRYLAEASAALASVVDLESTLQKVANLAVPYFADWSAVDVAENGGLRRLAVAHQDRAKVELVHQLMREYPPDPEAPIGAFAVLRTGKPELVSDIPDELLVQGTKDERHLRLIRSLSLKSWLCVPLVIAGRPFGVLTFATAESGRRYTEAHLTLAQDLAHRAAVAIENTRLYQTLRENDRRKDEFLAMLGHELRNPLATVVNGVQVLRSRASSGESVAHVQSLIERQSKHMTHLIDDLLDVTRISRGKIVLRKERLDLVELTRRTVEDHRRLVDESGCELELRLPYRALWIHADATRVHQLLGNLLHNACKFTEAGGRITVTLRAASEGEQAVVSIGDTGIGMARETLERLFVPFSQADSSLDRSRGGLGLGLALVKGLVELHGGTVRADSPGLGRGSEFVVSLPLSTDAKSGPDESQPSTASATDRCFRVLVVEDSAPVAEIFSMMLQDMGHEVEFVASGEEALRRIPAYRPQIVFSDISMPGMSGYELARHIREQSGSGDLILVAMTGYGQPEDRLRALQAGFDHHLVKPADIEQLQSLFASIGAERARA